MKFCVECGRTFIYAFRHRKDCPMRCMACCQYGYNFPCKDVKKVECKKCNRDFKSQECYDVHLKNGVCSIVIYCRNCECEDILHASAGGVTHECGKVSCQVCGKKHKGKECDK